MPQVEVTKQSTVVPRLIAVGAAVVVIGVVVGVFVYMNSQKPDTSAKTKSVLLSAEDKAATGKTDEAITALKAQLAAAKSDAEKAEIYMALGANYNDKNDTKAALDAFEAAGKLSPSYGTNDSIAQAAEKAGDKAKAIDYYKRNVELVKSGKAKQYAGELEDVEAAIKRLEGTK